MGKRQPNNSVSIGIGGTVAPEYPGGNVRMIARLSDGAVYLYQMTITGPNDDLFAGIPKLKNAAAGPATIILFPADNPDGINIIPIIIPK